MKYLVMYGSCGHGHQRAAEYVAEELKQRGEQDVVVLDFLTLTTRFCRRAYPFVYKYSVTYIPWLWAFGFYLTNIKWLNWFIRIVRRIVNYVNAPRLQKFITTANPAVIVLTHFFPAEVCSALKRRGRITSTVVTIVTDSIPHATWVNRYSDYFIGMSQKTKQALIDWGIAAEKVRDFGIPLSPRFVLQGKKREYQEKYALASNRLTILLTSGSFGIGPTARLVELLNTYQEDVQVMVVCGNNQTLFKKLQKREFSVPVKVFPFVDFMDELMEAADLVIAKSGGLTMCESLAKELPMIISRPIPGQETYNARFLLSHKAAFWIKKVEDIKPIIDAILKDKKILDNTKENIRTISKPHSTRDIVDFLMTVT